MRYLVMKDIIILRFVHLIMLVIGTGVGFLGIVADNIIISKVVYGYGIFVMVYIYLMILTQYNTKTKTDIIVNSFPIDRGDVVRAKYIVTALFIVFSAVIVFISSNIAIKMLGRIFNGSSANIFDILFIVGLSLVIFSLYLPFQYYSIGKVEIFSPIFLMVLAMGPSLLSRYGFRVENVKWIYRLVEMDTRSIMFILLGTGIIIYLISLGVSKQIYKRKEFY